MKLFTFEDLNEGQIPDSKCWFYAARKFEDWIKGKRIQNGYKFMLTLPFVYNAEYVDAADFIKKSGPCRKIIGLQIRKIRNQPPYRWMWVFVDRPLVYLERV